MYAIAGVIGSIIFTATLDYMYPNVKYILLFQTISLYTEFLHIFPEKKKAPDEKLVIVRKQKLIKCIEPEADVKSCSYKFINCTLKFNDEDTVYDIPLHNPLFSYFVVGNRINHNLIFYILKIQYDGSRPYTVTFIDHLVKIKHFTHEQYLHLKEDEYTIENNIKNKIEK